jgi:hypothetical protein
MRDYRTVRSLSNRSCKLSKPLREPYPNRERTLCEIPCTLYSNNPCTFYKLPCVLYNNPALPILLPSPCPPPPILME